MDTPQPETLDRYESTFAPRDSVREPAAARAVGQRQSQACKARSTSPCGSAL